MREVDTGNPIIHCFYHRTSDTRNRMMEIENIGMYGGFIKECVAILDARWEDILHAPIHGAAFASNTQYIDHELEDAGEVIRNTEASISRNYLKQIEHERELGEYPEHKCCEAKIEKAEALDKLS